MTEVSSIPVTSAPATSVNPGSISKTDAAPSPAQKAEVARMMKLKVDGQELELPESEVVALAQQGRSAAKRFQEAAQTRKEAEQIIAFAKANPTEFFQKTGMNARQWAEDYLMGEIKREAMSPEQKKAWENEERLKSYEKREKNAKIEAERAQMAQLERQHMENYDKMFVEALTASGLPKTPFTVMRMAQLTLSAEKKGIPVNSQQIAKLVREDYITEQKALFGATEGDALLEMLGKDVVKKLSKAQLSKYKASKTNNATPSKRVEEKSATKADQWKAFQKRNRSF